MLGWLANLWRWEVIGITAPFLYGLGVTAMYGDQYALANTLYFVAIALLTAKTLTWEETLVLQKRKKYSLALLICIFAAGAFFASLKWTDSRRQQIAPTKSEPTESKSVELPAANAQSPCRFPVRFTQKAITDASPDAPFGQQVSIVPSNIDIPELSYLRLYATKAITDGMGLGVIVNDHNFNPGAAGISERTGSSGLIFYNKPWADLWIKDVKKFIGSKSVGVLLYGPEPFTVICIEQEPVPYEPLIQKNRPRTD